jgi:hypothetical protein
VGLQALPLHQFEHLPPYLRHASIALNARFSRKFAWPVDDSRCAHPGAVLRPCSHSASRNACDEASDVGGAGRRAALPPDLR